jgi:hypothetical protein
VRVAFIVNTYLPGRPNRSRSMRDMQQSITVPNQASFRLVKSCAYPRDEPRRELTSDGATDADERACGACSSASSSSRMRACAKKRRAGRVDLFLILYMLPAAHVVSMRSAQARGGTHRAGRARSRLGIR